MPSTWTNQMQTSVCVVGDVKHGSSTKHGYSCTPIHGNKTRQLKTILDSLRCCDQEHNS